MDTIGVALAGATGSLALSKIAAAQDGGLVALIHTQAAGDNGPIDSMIAALKKLSEEKGGSSTFQMDLRISGSGAAIR